MVRREPWKQSGISSQFFKPQATFSDCMKLDLKNLFYSHLTANCVGFGVIVIFPYCAQSNANESKTLTNHTCTMV